MSHLRYTHKMRTNRRELFGSLLAAAAATQIHAADDPVTIPGKRPMILHNDRPEDLETPLRTCLPCHSLRLIHSQRLSRAAWNKELDKMAGWGSKYQDRDALLEYLVANYGDDRPMAPPAISGDGRKK